MAGPWEKYAKQKSDAQEDGAPWKRYKPSSAAVPATPGATSRFASSAADSSGLSGIINAVRHPFDTATSVAQSIANPYDQEGAAYKAVVPAVQNTVENARQAWKNLQSKNYAGAVTHGISAVPIVGPTLDKAEDQYADKDYAGEMGTLTGAAASLAAPKVIKEVAPAVSDYLKTQAEKLPEVADNAAAGRINKAVGARAADFKRGANPGRGYIKAKLGPSASMESIADKAATAKGDIANQLQDAYANATAAGKRIPVADVQKSIDRVIDNAKNSASGPGVLTDPDTYEELRKTFEPSLTDAEKNGGFTPQELWDIRKNIDRNLNWGDQSKLNMTKVQQRVSGSLGGLLKDAVPETVDLNQQYSDLNNLADRTEMRTLTHQSPLTTIKGKLAASAAGALAGHALPGGPITGALAGAAADPLPVRTALATWMSKAGRTAPDVAKGVGDFIETPLAQGAAPSLAAVTPNLAPVTGNSLPDPQGDTDNKENENGASDDLDQGTTPVVPNDTPKTTYGEKIVEPADPDRGVQPVSLPVTIPRTPGPQSELVSPETHVFSRDQWLQANPGGDHEAATHAAQNAGYEVV